MRLKRIELKDIKNNPYHYSEVNEYPKIFKNFSKNQQSLALKSADNNLKKRFQGINIDMPYAAKTAFNARKIKKKYLIKKIYNFNFTS